MPTRTFRVVNAQKKKAQWGRCMKKQIRVKDTERGCTLVSIVDRNRSNWVFYDNGAGARQTGSASCQVLVLEWNDPALEFLRPSITASVQSRVQGSHTPYQAEMTFHQKSSAPSLRRTHSQKDRLSAVKDHAALKVSTRSGVRKSK